MITFTAIFFTFTVLLVSHLVCILIGWNLAIKADPRLQMSKPDKKADAYESDDPFREEML